MSQSAFYLGGGKISVGISEEEIRAIEGKLRDTDANAPKLIASAINETGRHVKVGLAQFVGRYINLRAADIKDHISIAQVATPDNMVGVVRVDYKANPLEDFKAKFRQKSGGGVAVTTVKSEGVRVFQHMFRATMQSGHVGIFERERFTPKRVPGGGRYTLAARQARQKTTPGRKPRKLQPVVYRQSIGERVGPPIVGVLEKSPTLAEDVLADADAFFDKRLTSKMDWQLSKAAGAVPV